MIKVHNNVATREPMPKFLIGLATESLADLSWTDPALGVQDCAWWPEEVLTPSFDAATERLEQPETLTPDLARRVVVSSLSVVPIPAPELAERLDALKAAKNAEINAARLAANFSSFSYSGKNFATDQLSRSDIDGINGYVSLYDALPAGWPGAWKAMDNSYLPIADVTAWKLFYTAMVAAGNANFAKAQGLKIALAAATTPEQVAAIQW